jgi:PUA domain protein
LHSAKDFDELIVDAGAIYFVDGVPLLVRNDAGLLPSLKFMNVTDSLPRVVVDMGAVARIANGADVMRPGVRAVRRDFVKGDLVVIADEKYDKPIALGLADVDSAELNSISKGKVIRNVHYVGDEFWNAFGK